MKPRILFLLVAAVILPSFAPKAQTYDTNNPTVSTFAGSGFTGYTDAQGALAWFSNPTQIVSDTASNLFVWDSGNNVIRKITTSANVSTFAGGGTDFEGYGTNVSFSAWTFGKMAIDHANTLWISVQNVGYIYLLTVQSNTYVSIQNAGLTNLSTSSGLCFDSSNNLYYTGGNRVYRYNPIAGTSQVFVGSGNVGGVDGNGLASSFSSPSSIVADQADNLYVRDANGIRKVDQALNVSTITNSFSGTPMAVDDGGNLLFLAGNAIAKLTVKTNVIYYAGTPNFSSGTYTNGTGSLARFNNPSSACFSQGSIFVSDTGNQRIRQITFNPQTNIVTGANLGIGIYAGITFTGTVGRTYQIQSSPNMTTWTTQATLLLTASPYLWIDQNPVAGNKFYRAILLP